MRGASGLLSSAVGMGSGTGPQGFEQPDDQSGQMPDTDQPNADPQEQQIYDAFVKNAMEIIYDPKGQISPEVIKRLSTGKNYVDTLAQTAVWVVMLVESSAKKNGQDIPDDVILHAGQEIFEQLLEVDEKLGIHQFSDKEAQGAWYQALDLYRTANSDQGDRFGPDGGGPEAADAFSQLNQADQEGRADELVPGFYQQTEKAVAQAKMSEKPGDSQNDQEPDQDQDERNGAS